VIWFKVAGGKLNLLDGNSVIDLKFSLIIDTSDPSFLGFYSPDLEGFTGVGHSIEDCLYKARWGMEEHLAVLADQKISIPDANLNPTVVVQNEAELAPAA
jgi:predicted RNase H-like HicB family nuclease